MRTRIRVLGDVCKTKLTMTYEVHIIGCIDKALDQDIVNLFETGQY